MTNVIPFLESVDPELQENVYFWWPSVNTFEGANQNIQSDAQRMQKISVNVKYMLWHYGNYMYVVRQFISAKTHFKLSLSKLKLFLHERQSIKLCLNQIHSMLVFLLINPLALNFWDAVTWPSDTFKFVKEREQKCGGTNLLGVEFKTHRWLKLEREKGDNFSEKSAFYIARIWTTSAVSKNEWFFFTDYAGFFALMSEKK